MPSDFEETEFSFRSANQRHDVVVFTTLLLFYLSFFSARPEETP
jgi:hypothetical protein